MSNFPPECFPYFGHPLDLVDSPTVFHCPACDDYVFHTPTPSARTLVLDRAGDGPTVENELRPDRSSWASRASVRSASGSHLAE